VSGRTGFRFSWWWAFPVLLLIWIGFGAMRRSSADDRAAADKALAQSLADAQVRNFPACLDNAQRAIQLAPSMPEAHNNAGWCAVNLGKYDEGIASLREAIRLKPDFDIAKNNLNWAQGQKVQANAAPATPADAALLESLHHAQAQRFPDCITAARRAIELNPRSAEAYNNVGYCSGAMGKWDEGIEQMRKALQLRPDFPLASNNLAWMESERAKTRTNGARK
jgi:Flp pilus assembly protein TadD